MQDATRTQSTDNGSGPSGFDLDSTHTSEKTKNRNMWEEAIRYAWFNPQFWIELLTHPSTKLEKVYKRRRARLYSLLAAAFLIVSIVTNVLAFQDSRGTALVVTNFVVNLLLLASYVMSRTKYYLHAKNLGVLACWVLPYAAVVIQLNEHANTDDNDISVTDSFNWLFTPAWMLMAAVFLSRESTIALLILDSFSVLLIPGLSEATFFQIRKLLFFHMVNNLLLLLSTIIHFRDKLQLNQQQADAEGEGWERDPSTGQGPIARLLLQPHPEVVDRIFRRRSRVLSVVLLCLIPLTIIWSIAESLKWNNEEVDGALISMSVCLCFVLVILYALSRSKFTRWSSRFTLFLFLMVPYFYLAAPHTTQEGQLYAALLATTAAAILGVTLLSGQELITLACVVFFTTIYSPMFPPHIVMSVCLLCAALAHRHDMQEIERTKPTEDVRSQRVVSDGTNLKIPFDKKYCGGYMSYSNYVRFQYAFTFLLSLALGVVALVAIFRADVTESPLITVRLDGSVNSVQTNYKIYVTTFECSSSNSQQYDVSGTKGNFHFINEVPLMANTVTIINLQANGDIGAFTSVSMNLGNGNWLITNHDSCYIYKVEVWDVARNLGVTTQEDYYDPNAAQAAPQLKTEQHTTHAVAASQFAAQDWWNPRGVITCPRGPFDRDRLPLRRICDFNLVRGPLNWKKIFCPGPRNVDDERGGNLKCYTTQLPDYCNGHGTCIRGKCECDDYFVNAKKPTYSSDGRTVINNGYCLLPKAGACDEAGATDESTDPNQPTEVAKKMRFRSVDGACNYDIANQADDGLAGQPFGRILPASYEDSDCSFPRMSDNRAFPSERLISNQLFAEPASINTTGPFPFLSQLHYGFFRFLYNDMVFITQTQSIQFIWPVLNDFLRLPITINYLTETRNTGYAFKLKKTRKKLAVARQFDNDVTFWVDGSSIYGVDKEDEMFFREPVVTGTGKKKKIGVSETGRLAMECVTSTHSPTAPIDYTTPWTDCFPPTDDDDNFIVFDNRNFLFPYSAVFHVLFMREHNRLVDTIRRQANCQTADQYYIAAYGTPADNRDMSCQRIYTRPDTSPVPYYDVPRGQWDGTDMYRLVRMIVGQEIQTIAFEWIQAWYSRSGSKAFFPPTVPYPYTISPNVRLNSGLPLEVAHLFNLPTYQPEGFYARVTRQNGTFCKDENKPRLNDDKYLDDYIVTINQYLQGQVEAFVTNRNGVRTANRGSGDTIAILIRRGREMGLPSFTDVRDAVAVPAPKPVCPWNTWTDTVACNASALFKPASLAKLKTLYKTPSDVELIVGSLLSADFVPAALSPEINAVGIDRTQFYLVLGEIERVIQKDIFGIFESGLLNGNHPDTYFARFRNDDPNPFGFAVLLLQDAQVKSLSSLILGNSGVSCVQTAAFTARAGFDTLLEQPSNLFSLQDKGQAVDQRLNCDISEGTRDGFIYEGLKYNDLFCIDPTDCFRPSLPYCKDNPMMM